MYLPSTLTNLLTVYITLWCIPNHCHSQHTVFWNGSLECFFFIQYNGQALQNWHFDAILKDAVLLLCCLWSKTRCQNLISTKIPKCIGFIILQKSGKSLNLKIIKLLCSQNFYTLIKLIGLEVSVCKLVLVHHQFIAV